MKRLQAAFLVLTMGAAWAAGGCTRSISDRNIVLVSPDEGRQLMAEHKKLLGLGGSVRGAWVDPRNEQAYRMGHIAGAISLPFQNLATEKGRLRGYDVLIVYGESYDDEIADGMSKRLMELGFKDVRTLRGGLRAWTEAGFELQTGPPPPGP